MASKVAEGITRGLTEAVAFAQGDADKRAYAVHVPASLDVKAIRTGLGLSQQAFAGRFGFSIKTLRHWEQGQRAPEGPARAYLTVIARDPAAVQRALSDA